MAVPLLQLAASERSDDITTSTVSYLDHWGLLVLVKVLLVKTDGELPNFTP